MITPRRAGERRDATLQPTSVWLATCPGRPEEPLPPEFGAFHGIDEIRIPPRTDVPLAEDWQAETLTYVHEGGVCFRDGPGRSEILKPGDFLRTVARGSPADHGRNLSRVEWAHLFRIRLRPSVGRVNGSFLTCHFPMADRRDQLRAVASPAGEGGMALAQDCRVFSVLLTAGRHVAHALLPGRSAWVHVVRGEVGLGEVALSTGDGAGIWDEHVVSITAHGDGEILLLDLPGSLPS